MRNALIEAVASSAVLLPRCGQLPKTLPSAEKLITESDSGRTYCNVKPQRVALHSKALISSVILQWYLKYVPREDLRAPNKSRSQVEKQKEEVL